MAVPPIADERRKTMENPINRDGTSIVIGGGWTAR
jgi:hypothetical protein